MRQEKYLDKAISKLEKDLRKAGLSDMYTISGRIENRIPILDVSNNEIGSARTYNLANAYIMYLEEDVSAAESFKDTRREIMADVCRENPIEVQPEDVTEIDPTSNLNSEFDTTEIDIEDETPVSRTIKATQIVVRTTEKEREALKAYFMKHGVSLSKGIKIAIKYLEQQEKKGLVHFSDIGLY